MRQNYFEVQDLKTLFKYVDPSYIFTFLKEIGLFKEFKCKSYSEIFDYLTFLWRLLMTSFI